MALNIRKKEAPLDSWSLEDLVPEYVCDSRGNKSALRSGGPILTRVSGSFRQMSPHSRIFDLSTPMLVDAAVFRAKPNVPIYRDPSWADFDTIPHPEDSSSVVTTHDDQLALSIQRFVSLPEATTCRETTFENETTCFASEFEAAYRRLRGRSADVDVAKNYFKLYGELAATWLVRRMRQEYSVDCLDAAGDVLSRLGKAALRSVLDALNIPEKPEFHAALLRTLRWLPQSATQDSEDDIVDVISQYLNGRDPDLVELAIRATRCLSVARRKSLLENAQATVTDADIAGQLAEELARP